MNYVRVVDTFDFKEVEKEEAFFVEHVFHIFGREKYITYFFDYIQKEEKLVLNDTLRLLIDLEKDKVKRYLEQKEKEMFRIKIDDYVAGVVYAENYRSEIGDHLVKTFSDIDFAIIINVSRSVSYRG